MICRQAGAFLPFSAKGESRAQRRSAIVDAAQDLLLQQGFAATTIANVATAAGVSVETIYKTFGGKAGLVRAICDRALAGRGPIHAEVRSDEMAHRERDPREIIRQWGVLTTEVAPRISPILLLVRDAAATIATWRPCKPTSKPNASHA